MNLILQLVIFLALGYFGIVGFMYWRQESFLFYPPVATHADESLNHVEEYSFARAGVTLKGWLVNPLYARHKIIIYYGGNGEDVYLNVDEYEAIRLIDYEGMKQEECASQMEIARTTVQKMYNDARKKIALMIINGDKLI